jgi:acyl-CoA synthetase (AMP-forming)/AMP-acid ligase II
MSRLLDWFEDPSSATGIAFLRGDGQWRRFTYDELAAAADAAAAQLAARVEAAEEGGVVPILVSAGPRFVAAFFGALRAGLTPCPLAPPTFLSDPDVYRDHLQGILQIAQPAAVVVEAEFEAVVQAAVARLPIDPPLVHLDGEPGGGARGGRSEPPELALLQFTSGSTGRPRGVRVGTANLEANIGMIERWLALRHDDRAVSWLPLFHDMGLIGALITPIVRGMDALIMPPEQFMRSPMLWLDCFDRLGGTCSASPSFGFAYLAKRLPPDELARLDLSRWRIAIAGAERLDAGAMARFARLAKPAGFRPETFAPAFGMAEATLAVTGVPADEVPLAVRLDWSGMRFGDRVDVIEQTHVDDADRIGAGVGWAVDCGVPLPGLSVRVVDGDGDPLPDGHVGEIVVEGPSVCDGYSADGREGDTAIDDGVLRTGDAGMVFAGRLFALGRMADSVSVRGRNLYAEDLETAVAAVDGVSRGRCAVFSGVDQGAPVLVCLVEEQPGAWVDAAGRLLRREAGDEATVHVVAAERGTIARTSSGKPRRRAMAWDFLEGSLPGEVVWSNRAAATGTRETG